jgi:soluble lytic murein transglycosylase
VQLGEANAGLSAAEGAGANLPSQQRWEPLASGDADLDRLWRLDQPTEAWESWRSHRDNQPPRDGQELLVEGRLRQGVGDDWTAFAQLEQAALRLRPDQCALLPALERSLHPNRFLEVFQPLAQQWRLPLELLLGLAKQESRFSPTVRSAAGAVGLMQLLPGTASELAGKPVSEADLLRPARNAELGSLYLRRLLDQWRGDPLPAVASYNAGPGAVAPWISPRLQQAPELWVEAIPFPETRLYVKKVLGNAWSYRNRAEPHC